ncbi:MAG: hypothetical protein ACYTBJ_16595, partial [Planctomycetota bacterium]
INNHFNSLRYRKSIPALFHVNQKIWNFEKKEHNPYSLTVYGGYNHKKRKKENVKGGAKSVKSTHENQKYPFHLCSARSVCWNSKSILTMSGLRRQEG